MADRSAPTRPGVGGIVSRGPRTRRRDPSRSVRHRETEPPHQPFLRMVTKAVTKRARPSRHDVHTADQSEHCAQLSSRNPLTYTDTLVTPTIGHYASWCRTWTSMRWDQSRRRRSWAASSLAWLRAGESGPAAADFAWAASVRNRRVVVRESWFSVVRGGPTFARSVSQVITAPPCAPCQIRSVRAAASGWAVQPTLARAWALVRSVAVLSCTRSRSGSRSRMTRISVSAWAARSPARAVGPVVRGTGYRTVVGAGCVGGCCFLVVGSSP